MLISMRFEQRGWKPIEVEAINAFMETLPQMCIIDLLQNAWDSIWRCYHYIKWTCGPDGDHPLLGVYDRSTMTSASSGNLIETVVDAPFGIRHVDDTLQSAAVRRPQQAPGEERLADPLSQPTQEPAALMCEIIQPSEETPRQPLPRKKRRLYNHTLSRHGNVNSTVSDGVSNWQRENRDPYCHLDSGQGGSGQHNSRTARREATQNHHLEISATAEQGIPAERPSDNDPAHLSDGAPYDIPNILTGCLTVRCRSSQKSHRAAAS